MKRSPIAALVLVGSIVACRTSSHARVKDDGLASSGVAASCAGSMASEPPFGAVDASELDPDARIIATDAVKQALSAVPNSVKDGFFKRFAFRLVQEVSATTCPGNAVAVNGHPSFCWTTERGRLTAVLKADPKVIQREVLRVFVYAAFDAVAPTINHLSAAQRAQKSAAVAAQLNLKRRAASVSAALALDVTGVAAAANASTAAEIKKATTAAAQAYLARAALAEAFAREACSPATRAAFSTAFPKTHAAYTAGATVTDILTAMYTL